MQQDFYNFGQAMNPMNLNMGTNNPYMAAAAVAAAYGTQYPVVNSQFQNYPQVAAINNTANMVNYPQLGQTLPTQKVRNQMYYVDGRRFEDMSNSTDESIHLVRSRKHGGKFYFNLKIC
jgi:hypothetical protein